MDGAEGARKLIQGHLTAVMPGVLTTMETALALAPGTLKVPKVTGPTDMRSLGLEEMPAVVVAVRDMPVGPVNDGGEYQFRYEVRCLAWARGKDYDDTGDNRDRYVLALRKALLGRLALGVPKRSAKVLTGSWRESYSEVARGANERGLAAGYVQFQVELVEVLAA